TPLPILPPFATTTSPLSLHAALPILFLRMSQPGHVRARCGRQSRLTAHPRRRALMSRGPDCLRHGSFQSFDVACKLIDHGAPALDRKSTRLNSSHVKISYAVFCLKKK